MKIERKSIRGNGSCNFCSKGELGADEKSLKYPYSEVTQVSSDNSGVMINFCDECLSQLKLFGEVL